MSDAEQAWRLASAGVMRDASDPLALALCGHIKAFLFHEYVAAIAYFDQAINFSPNHAWAWTLSSGTYAYMGQAKAAIRRAELGLLLSPADRHAFYYLSFLGLAHYADESYEKAAEWERKALGQNSHFRAGLRVLAASLVALGRLEEAQAVARDLLQEQPSFRVSRYAPQCPWRDPAVRETFLSRLIRGRPSRLNPFHAGPQFVPRRLTRHVDLLHSHVADTVPENGDDLGILRADVEGRVHNLGRHEDTVARAANALL